MGMESATLRKGLVIASRATQAMPVRISAQTFAVVRVNVPLEDACALLALSASTARSRPVAVDMEIALYQEVASAAQVGWVLSAVLLCNVLTPVAVAMEIVKMETVPAQLGSLASHAKVLLRNVANALLVVSAIETLVSVCVEVLLAKRSWPSRRRLVVVVQKVVPEVPAVAVVHQQVVQALA